MSCGICFDELVGEINSSTLCGCKLMYHNECLQSWYLKMPCCPVCRKVNGTSIQSQCNALIYSVSTMYEMLFFNPFLKNPGALTFIMTLFGSFVFTFLYLIPYLIFNLFFMKYI